MTKKNFIIFFFILSSILTFTIFYLSFLFLKAHNEHLSVENIIMKQQSTNSIYSSSINLDYHTYIEKKYKKIKPEIVILGTSTVQYYPSFFFTKDFLIAQQPFYSFEMFHSSIKNLIQIHKPKILIVGIDWWLFNKNFNKTLSKFYLKNLFEKNLKGKTDVNKTFLNFSFNELIKPYVWLFEKKISLNYFILSITQNMIYDEIGLAANLNNSGYDFNGYYVDNFRVSGKKKYDQKFEDTIAEIMNKKKSFIDFEFDEKSITTFNLINKLSKDNYIKILFYMPPVAPTIYQILNETNYINNFELINQKLNSHQNFFNFTSMDYYNDCYFIDGYHSGEVLNYINLKKMLTKFNLDLQYLNTKITPEIIKKNKFRATFKDLNKKILAEYDFLKLGCSK